MAKDKRPDEVSDQEQAADERETVESELDTDASGKPARADVAPAPAEQHGTTNQPLPEEEAHERKAK